ncbi:flagellar motor protein MotB [Desulfocurvibacter africanus]|uniref:OmpA/MotB domain protein n=2 Tax=Desulfocurvibacter africanus TaxID=873 RepID=F3YX96_DESAF|nr:flagellar motor protein MotB [Desulfocurvibacter africanus]EGJ50594.1 OmpA/MotB domain protein [Desulfocurvibacter africanus subsp. africanus str. Walvis Bay]EMG38127.1 flagellar motor protein [Desulfocurvibacter africanus PCS]
MTDEELQNRPLDSDDEESQDNSSDWLTTFADLSLLLLCFFILLFSMSNLDLTKFTDSFQAVQLALQGNKKDLSSSRIVRDEQAVLIDQVKLQRQIMENQRKLFTEVQFYQNTKGLKGVVGAHFDKGIITLRVPSDVMFAPGQVELTTQGVAVLRDLKDLLIKHADQRINIRGFTDDVRPSGNSRFKDNWEISAMRSVNVLRVLMSLGMEPTRLTATGLADLEPLFPNNSTENRARNRRIEITLEKRVGG